MNFNSSDYQLNKEYQNRMQHTVNQHNRAAEVRPDSPLDSVRRHPRLVLIGLALGIMLVFTIMSANSVHAQDTSPIFDTGSKGKAASDWFNIGAWYIGQQMYEEAVVELTVALTLYPEFGSAYAARDVSLYHLGRYEEAIADYSSAILIFPGYASAYNYRGMAHLAQGNTEQAVADAQRAALLNANYANAHWTVGSAYMEAKDFAAAQASFERYVVLAGMDANPDAAQMIALCEDQLNA